MVGMGAEGKGGIFLFTSGLSKPETSRWPPISLRSWPLDSVIRGNEGGTKGRAASVLYMHVPAPCLVCAHGIRELTPGWRRVRNPLLPRRAFLLQLQRFSGGRSDRGCLSRGEEGGRRLAGAGCVGA